MRRNIRGFEGDICPDRLVIVGGFGEIIPRSQIGWLVVNTEGFFLRIFLYLHV